MVIDSLNMLDPTRNRTADNLSALKTYNHEKGLTCLCLGRFATRANRSAARR